MKKVKIINGIYGHRPNGGIVVPVSPADGAIELSDEEAVRLIKLGVAAMAGATELPEAFQLFGTAVKVAAGDDARESGTGAVATPQGGNADGEAGEDTPEENGGEEGAQDAQEKTSYNVVMKVDELRALLNEHGVPYRVGMTKADMVAALDEYFSGGEDDGETPPALAAEEPVT